MRSRAPLALLEQILMLLVFAVAAVICLRVFLWSDDASRRGADRDHALVCAQTAAEVLKSCGGDLDRAAETLGGTTADGQWVIAYDEEWDISAEEEEFTLRAAPLPQNGLLGRAEVTVVQGEDTLAALTVAWQEVAP